MIETGRDRTQTAGIVYGPNASYADQWRSQRAGEEGTITTASSSVGPEFVFSWGLQ